MCGGNLAHVPLQSVVVIDSEHVPEWLSARGISAASSCYWMLKLQVARQHVESACRQSWKQWTEGSQDG